MTQPAEGSAAAREIQTRMFDSARWNHVALRDDDIIVATWAKSGTTLTQQMVAQLVSGGEDDGVASIGSSPWVDVRFMMPLEALAAMLEAQTHRRCLKTHLPFEALPYSASVKYVYVGRDARDVLWSVYDHCSAFTPEAFAAINAVQGPWPEWSAPDVDAREYYLNWLETGATPGFHDLPFWSHVQGWWNERRRPNVLLLHYANLIADMPGEMRRLADFLEIPIDEAGLPRMLAHCGIDYMRAQASGPMSQGPHFFEKGAASFFNKGANGRWRDVLSPAEAARCDEVAARNLTPDCAHWLKTGEGA